MQETKNYQLNQWEPTDEVRREDFNNDNAAIDAALKAVADTAGSKASAESVTALEQSVNTSLASITSNLGSKGKNARIAWGSYTGNGKYGSDNPTSITFDFKPMDVFITSGSTTVSLHRPLASHTYLKITWSDNKLSWYTTTETNPVSNQLNTSGTVYNYVVIGYEE